MAAKHALMNDTTVSFVLSSVDIAMFDMMLLYHI